MIFANPPLMKAMFTIGLCTGLREGDVATLKWSEISGYNNRGTKVTVFLYREINRITRKTHAMVHIPVEMELAQCLAALAEQRDFDKAFSEYVIPEAAEMYLTKSNSLPYAIHKFLTGIVNSFTAN